MKTNNFTTSDIWRFSNKQRFGVSFVESFENVDFFVKENSMICLQYFDLNFTEKLIFYIKKKLQNNQSVFFKYINMTDKNLENLNQLCQEYGIVLKVEDVWDSPQLFLKQKLSNYVSKSRQLKRNYKAAEKDKTISYKIFDGANISLWLDVLFVDKNSWKGDKHCDMISLDREDLQYVFYLLNNPQNSSLFVGYVDEKPVAYSLLFRANEAAIWYAVKWGASYEGRKKYAGIKTLFYQLNYIQQNEGVLNVDLWGRRSQFYDILKNCDTKRYHFKMELKNES